MSAGLFKERIADSIRSKNELLSHVDILQTMAEAILSSYRHGGKVLIFGNGGSAADAQHIAGEFVGRYYFDRSSLPAIALAADSATLTAIGNDYGYDEVFARQIRGFGRPGDVAIGLSTSGNSQNVVKALEVARSLGLITMAFTGRRTSEVDLIVDHVLKIPTADTPRVQEGYMFALHVICEYIEDHLFRPTQHQGTEVVSGGHE